MGSIGKKPKEKTNMSNEIKYQAMDMDSIEVPIDTTIFVYQKGKTSGMERRVVAIDFGADDTIRLIIDTKKDVTVLRKSLVYGEFTVKE